MCTMYTVISRKVYNHTYEYIYCLGIYSTKDGALKIIEEDKAIIDLHVYTLFSCEVDEHMIINEDDDVLSVEERCLRNIMNMKEKRHIKK